MVLHRDLLYILAALVHSGTGPVPGLDHRTARILAGIVVQYGVLRTYIAIALQRRERTNA